MSTDPFVAPVPEAEPRNEPTLAPGLRLPPARDWRVGRPGDLVDGVQPHGLFFGSPGPNVGYAMSLTHRAGLGFVLADHEDRHDAEAVVATVAMRRAASFGRGPVVSDVEHAAELLGYGGGASSAFVAWRADAVAGAHHEYGARLRISDAVPTEVLRGPVGSAADSAAAVQAALVGSP